MKRHQVLVGVLVACGFFAITCPESSGRVWTVAQDGGGDFAVIQHAVDAAEDGDVIEIGPGQYIDYAVISGVGHVYVYLDGTKSLTFIGAGRDGTTIGPIDYVSNSYRYGVYSAAGPASIRIEQLRIMNFNTCGLRLGNAFVEIDNVVIEMSDVGIFLRPTNEHVSITDCMLLDGPENGLRGILSGAPRVEILDTVFDGIPFALDVNYPGSTEVLVDRCEFVGAGVGIVGIQFSLGAGGTVQNCRISGFRNYGFVPSGAGTVTFRHNLVEDCFDVGIGFEGVQNIVVHDNIVTRCGIAVYVGLRPISQTIYNNHFLRYSEADDGWRGYFVRTTSYYPYSPHYLDFANNYWGTTDTEEISTWIFDGYDDPNVFLYVVFEPIADGPVSMQQQTWTEVKSMFR